MVHGAGQGIRLGADLGGHVHDGRVGGRAVELGLEAARQGHGEDGHGRVRPRLGPVREDGGGGVALEGGLGLGAEHAEGEGVGEPVDGQVQGDGVARADALGAEQARELGGPVHGHAARELDALVHRAGLVRGPRLLDERGPRGGGEAEHEGAGGPGCGEGDHGPSVAPARFDSA